MELTVSRGEVSALLRWRKNKLKFEL